MSSIPGNVENSLDRIFRASNWIVDLFLPSEDRGIPTFYRDLVSRIQLGYDALCESFCTYVTDETTANSRQIHLSIIHSHVSKSPA